MNDLISIYQDFERIGTASDPSQIDYEALFNSATLLIEATNFSSPENLFELLQKKNQEEILLMPFWYRSMAFRILVAKAPQHKTYINAAIADLQFFGSSYTPVIDEYKKMLQDLLEES